ncbi:MAG TPA: DUF3391 domain-containing protein [Arenimonas sp.]|nr:DUF3391 domain-containing protein [Arenimonas sp.]
MKHKKKTLPPREVRIHVLGLRPGMCISRLDRPWSDTPYRSEGITLRDADDIRRLQGVCNHVYVDTASGTAPEARYLVFEEPEPPHRDGPRDEYGELRQRHWPAPTDFDAALPVAREAYARLQRAVVARDTAADAATLLVELEPAVGAIIAGPAPLLWLLAAHVRQTDANAEIVARVLWALAFGRELGMDATRLRQFALAALLYELPAGLDVEPPAAAPPMAIQIASERLGKAVAERLQAIAPITGLPPQVPAMLGASAARHDGRGHPWAQRGEEIPLPGRLLAVVVRYAALTCGNQRITPRQAAKLLYEERGQRWQPALVEHFLAVCGLYPPGALVELSDGRAGVVVDLRPEQRLRPRVVLLRDAQGQPLQPPRIVDLAVQLEDAEGRPLNLRRDLADATLDIDAATLRAMAHDALPLQ